MITSQRINLIWMIDFLSSPANICSAYLFVTVQWFHNPTSCSQFIYCISCQQTPSCDFLLLTILPNILSIPVSTGWFWSSAPIFVFNWINVTPCCTYWDGWPVMTIGWLCQLSLRIRLLWHRWWVGYLLFASSVIWMCPYLLSNRPVSDSFPSRQ